MKFGIIGNLAKPGLLDAVTVLVSHLEQAGIEYIVDREILKLFRRSGQALPLGRGAGQEECTTGCDILVAFGGDGTMLSAARLVGKRETPILGVNLGKLGFLAELSAGELESELTDIIHQDFVVEERMVLEATSPQAPRKVFHGLNDVVIHKSRSPRVIDLEAYVNGVFAVSYRCDGLVVSTPTGSTAYALSNGGPIVTPTSDVIGITPISPHTLSGRPIILPGISSIRVVAGPDTEELLLSVDGQEEALVRRPLEVFIKRADYTVRLVKRKNRSYFDVLRAKLLWGKVATSV